MKPNQLSLTEALDGLKQKRFSSQELVQSCLEQIKTKDSLVKAFLTLNEKALDQAKLADKDSAVKPLKGIPVAVKDNFLTKGLKTTASAKLLEDFIPTYSATVVKRLAAAGAIILGKTNMDAWAHGSSTESSDFGPTHNPWNLAYLPGGSSGGSAAAVSADMCTFAIGTETAGSIRQPAAWCGVTGFKPSYGRVSRYGVIAMASSTDSPGPLAKTAADTALITQIIAGQDPYDATTSSLPVGDYLSNLNQSIKGFKIAVPKEYLSKDLDPRVIKLINQAIEKFKALGAVIEPVSLLDPKYAIGVYTLVQRAEVSSNLARYDGVRFGHDRSSFSSEAKNRMMLGTYILSSRYHQEGELYIQAQKVRALIINDFNRLFKNFDLYLGPTSPGPALKLGGSKNNPMFGELEDRLVEASSIAGLTGISLPCGFINGLPIGLQLTANQFNETKVFQVAQAYQQATDYHLQKPDL
ncbi:MAG: Asp-tRNA(Asn)/Glu-tRNA(Gln) amidotransferase subunit GatA [Candidatus Beckwithbacteria bacterium]